MKTEKKTVTVCSACQRACCWQGRAYCENYKKAGTKEMTVDELKKLDLEHKSFWENK